MAEMQNTAFELDDGMTEAERNYFSTGGDVNNQLANENQRQAPADDGQQPDREGGAPPPPVDYGDEIVEGEATPRRVSFQRFEREQQQRMDLERRIHDMQVNGARVEERLAILQQALQEPGGPAAGEGPATPAPLERPDPQQDIFGYANYLETMVNQLGSQLEQVNGKINAYETQITSDNAQRQSDLQYFDSLNQYAGRQPDFVSAYQYLMQNRAMELMAQRYPSATIEQLRAAAVPSDVTQIMQEEERDLYRSAREGNRNPGADIYQFARLRGYQPQQRQAANGQGNGAAQPQRAGTPLGAPPGGRQVAAVPAGRSSATDIVNAIRNGQGAARSLGNVSGGGNVGLNSRSLADMSEDDFADVYNAVMASNNKQAIRDLMGH